MKIIQAHELKAGQAFSVEGGGAYTVKKVLEGKQGVNGTDINSGLTRWIPPFFPVQVKEKRRAKSKTKKA